WRPCAGNGPIRRRADFPDREDGTSQTTRKESRVAALKPVRWPDLRRAHGLGHAVEYHDALAAAARRERLRRAGVTAVDVLPVVHRPDVARRIDVDVSLHLQPASDVAAGRRNLVAGPRPRQAAAGKRRA